MARYIYLKVGGGGGGGYLLHTHSMSFAAVKL